MRFLGTSLIGLLAVILGCASVPPAPVPSWTAVTVSGAHQIDLVSQHTGRTHRLFVSMPPGPAPAEGFPVLYLLDGNAYFPAADRYAHTLTHLGRGFGLSVTPPIVVGLGYPDVALFDAARRTEDYTPPGKVSDEKRQTAQGGADRFRAFIEKEVKPLIAGRWPVNDAQEALMGHSYGGLFTLHVLFTRPELFDTYVAGSPSIWWNDRFILGSQQRFVDALSGRAIDARLLVTVGSLEETAPPFAPGRRRMLEQRRMVRSARELVEALSGHKSTGLTVRLLELTGEDHHGAALPMLTRGMLFFSLPALLPGSH